jgi:hypothetical protein
MPATTSRTSLFDQDDATCFLGHVGAGPDRHADVGDCQRWRIVDAIAHQRHHCQQ